MPARPFSTFLLLSVLSFPVSLMAGGISQTLTFSYPLATGGRLSIYEPNGTIAVSSWDQNEISITATKQADSQADLDAIRIDIKHENDAIEVRTTYSSSGQRSGRVSYRVMVPRNIGKLVAKTSNGSISAENVGGDVVLKSENGAISATNLKGSFSLDTTNGSISARCSDLAGDGHLRAVNGSITLTLSGSADALIEARTAVGRIRSNLPANKTNKMIVGETLQAKLGAGSHHLEVQTTNGSIKLEAT